jgi:hypothetical protein
VPDLDATAVTATQTGFAAAYYLFLDINGDPLRVTTYGTDVTFSATGDSDLDGTYNAFGGQLLDFGPISNSESGSDTFSITLSGIVSMDTTLINEMGDKSKWQGRLCRVWMQLYDPTGATEQGAIVPLKLGYMSSVSVGGRPGDQSITLSVESWLAAFNQASNRSYLNQADYDASDTSAQATIACSNGMRRDSGASGGATPAPSGPGDSYGYTGGGGYSNYSPYPDNGSVQYDNPNYLRTSRA